MSTERNSGAVTGTPEDILARERVSGRGGAHERERGCGLGKLRLTHTFTPRVEGLAGDLRQAGIIETSKKETGVEVLLPAVDAETLGLL